MPQQNKTVASGVNDRKKQLEAELTEPLTEHAEEIVPETGRRKVLENSAFQRNALASDSKFNIHQGFRRRHPNTVLNQFAGIAATTTSASTQWEKYMLHETEKVEVDKELQPKDDADGLVNQLGIAQVAEKNFKNVHKKSNMGKLQRMHLVGV